MLLRRVTCNVGQIIYSPNQKAFVSLSVDGQQVPFAAEEYADLIGTYLSTKYFSLLNAIFSSPEPKAHW